MILARFDDVRRLTLAVLDAVPEPMLDRRFDPPGTMKAATPAGELAHIAAGCDWWMSEILRDGQGIGPESDQISRRDVLAWLGSSQQRVQRFFEADAARFSLAFPHPHGPQRTGGEHLLLIMEHEVHHRAKLMLVLRQWGVTQLPTMPL